MVSELQAADHIRTAIQRIVEADDDGPYLIGDLVLIAEVTASDGSVNLITVHNVEISRWKELGFLHGRLHSINSDHFELGEWEPEDDD